MLMTISEASKVLGYHDTTIHRWVKAGRIPSIIDAHGIIKVDYDDFVGFIRDNNIKRPFKKPQHTQPRKVEEPKKEVSGMDKLIEFFKKFEDSNEFTPKQYNLILETLNNLGGNK